MSADDAEVGAEVDASRNGRVEGVARGKARALTPVQRALELLTRREHSSKELARKLAARGVASDEATKVVEKLTQSGWQDDARFAESLARYRAVAGFGPLRIRAELRMHGLAAEQIAAALSACQTDWAEAARLLVARRFPRIPRKDKKLRSKVIELLLRRGFDRGCAFAAVCGSDDIADDAWEEPECSDVP